MRNQPETAHEYNIPRLNWWFFLSSLVFVGCLVLMVWVDYSGGTISWLALRGDRQWKNHQYEFYALEKKRLAADEQAAEVRAHEAGLDKVESDTKKLETQLGAKKHEIAALQAEADRRQVETDHTMREFTIEKANRDQYRSFYEAALERHELNRKAPEVVEWEDKVKTQNALVDRLDLRKQEADAELAAAQDKLNVLIGQRDDLEKQKGRLLASRDIVAKRLRELNSQIVQFVVNAPVVEFAVPTYKVEQIVAEDHHVDVNFTTVPRVDRCITCHKGIDRKDPTPEDLSWRKQHKIEAIEWSKLPQPLRNHPRMDLYVSDTSPHPASKFGCTVCHWGWDRETTFSRAGHTPDDEEKHPYVADKKTGQWVKSVTDEDEEDDSKTTPKVQTVSLTQQDAWEKNHHWEHEEFLRQPMRAGKYVQASCLKCHADQTSLPGGEKLDHARRLIGQLGCWGCHKMKQMETYSTHKIKEGEDFDSICTLYDVEPDQVRRLNNIPGSAVVTVIKPEDSAKFKSSAIESFLKEGQDLQIPIRTLHKDGPSLYKVATKDNPEWVRKWLANPVAFKPNTYMPRFWGLENNTQDPDRDVVEQNAITEYLFAVSERPQYPAPPVAGDAARGKQVVSQVGCLACHVIDEKVTDLKLPKEVSKYMDVWAYRRARSQGPQLAGLGSKTTANWLYAWIKDPKQYHPGTKMPNLRLSDQDAADAAAYLVSLRHEKTDKQEVPAVKPNRLDEVTTEYLEVTLPHETAVQKIHDLDDLIERYFADEETAAYYDDPARLVREEAQLKALQKEFEETFDDAVDKKAKQLAARLETIKAKQKAARDKVAAFTADQKKNVYLGSKLITRYGCFACHDIHGFENAKPIGTELSEWGSKPVSKLDFGLREMEHNRIAFLKQKLHAPRSYDLGRIGVTRKPQELLKMPQFNLNPEQIDQIVTFVSGMTDEKLTYQEPRQLSPAEFTVERGRWLIKEVNCVGCHIIEGKGGAIRATGVPAGMEPPLISGMPTQLRQGQRTQPDWLFHFLKSPKTGEVRPWLKVHMPTFGLSDAEANILVKYFALEGRTEFPYVTPKIDLTPEHLAAGKQIFEALQCAQCHIVEGRAKGKPLAEIPEEQLPDLAPPLNLAYRRLQRDWLVHKWLVDPGVLVPSVRMPQFEYGTSIPSIKNVLGGDGLKQREALVDYIMSLGLADETAKTEK